MSVIVRIVAAISLIFALGGFASHGAVRWVSLWSLCLSGTALYTGDWYWLLADFAGLWLARLLGFEPR